MTDIKHEFSVIANDRAIGVGEPLAVAVALQPAPVDTREFVRFTRLHRALHACMIISFLTLALTGMSLKFSYTAWAFRLARILGGFETAGFIHRTAAIVMFGTFTTHIVSLIRDKRRNHLTCARCCLDQTRYCPLGATPKNWRAR